MKALVMTGPGEFTLEDRPMPEPRNDEILVKVPRVGVCFPRWIKPDTGCVKAPVEIARR
jgi:NADPH:quinone reductase-like Zn-dependent oxidoreductase